MMTKQKALNACLKVYKQIYTIRIVVPIKHTLEFSDELDKFKGKVSDKGLSFRYECTTLLI